MRAGRRGGIGIGGKYVPAIAAAALAAVLMACGGDVSDEAEWEPLLTFDTTSLMIVSDGDTVRITAEIAGDADRRAYGLMERPGLPPGHGMIFVYPEPQDSAAAFYMYRTLIPLDIAFLDDEGRILSIRAMEPCRTPNPRLCPRYGPGEPFSAALEMNLGFFERHGVGVGDRVVSIPSTTE